jgi:dTDP-4-amino-4,6-dideoxygalactose transaminase
MPEIINVFQPSLGAESLSNLKDVFESNWLGRGTKVAEFEASLANFLGCRKGNLHTVNCATDSIFQILKVLSRTRKAGVVVIPAISFPAVGSAVLEAGFELLICDVDPLTAQIDLMELEEIVNTRKDLVAVFTTHYGGGCVDTDAVRSIIGNDVYILEDSACALGSRFPDGEAVGTKADFSCWSFDSMKLLVCGEGAAVHIKDEELLKLFKEQCYLGLPAKQKSGLDQSSETQRWWEYELNTTGVRSVFTDINAAIGLSQLPLLNDKLVRKDEIRDQYRGEIDQLRDLNYLNNVNVSQSSNYFFTVISDRRDQLAHFLKDNGIYSTFRYYPLSEIKLFQKYVYNNCAMAKKISDTFLNIPIHDALSDNQVRQVRAKLKEFSAR